MGNIVTAFFPPGSNRATTAYRYQWDYGQILQFSGITLPSTYMVHFSNYVDNEATKMLGDEDGVEIPDAYLMTGLPVYAWVYLHTGEDDGETVYEVTIPVRKRSQPTDETPTPAQQSIIDQLEEAVEDLDDRMDDVEAAVAGGYITDMHNRSVTFSNELTIGGRIAESVPLYSAAEEVDGWYKHTIYIYTAQSGSDRLSTIRPVLSCQVYSQSEGVSIPASMRSEGEPGNWTHHIVTFYWPTALTGNFDVSYYIIACGGT